MNYNKRTKKDIVEHIEKPYKEAKVVMANTLKVWYEDGSVAYRYHDTDVVTYKDNTVTLNSGEFKTKTTSRRIEEFTNFWIVKDNWVWYVVTSGEKYTFYDGMTLNINTGKIIGEEKTEDTKKVNEVNKKINDFVRLITEENMPQPDPGDCWMCALKDSEGKTWGDHTDNTHLWEHIEQGYMHGSLIVNALEEAGHRPETCYYLKIIDTMRRAVRRYLKRRLMHEVVENH